MNMKHIARVRILTSVMTVLALTGFLLASEPLGTGFTTDTDLSGYWQVELRGIQSGSNADKPAPYLEIAYLWMLQEADGVLWGGLTFGDDGGLILTKTGDEESQDSMSYAAIRATGLVTASRFWLMGQGTSFPQPPPIESKIDIIIDNYEFYAIMAWGVTMGSDMIVGKFHYMIFEGIPNKNSIGDENYTGMMGTFRAYKIGEIIDDDF